MFINILRKISDFYKVCLVYIKKKPITFSILGVIIIGFFVYKGLFSTGLIDETTVAKNGSLSQSVRVTGTVQASKEASLSFQTIGQVAYVGVKIGDVVPQGKVLATLSAGDAQANLLQAKATLENAQATLDQMTQGARPEEIAIKQQAVDNAQATLDQTYLTIPDVIQNVDSTTADIIKNKLAPIFTYNGSGYSLSFSSCDQKLQNIIESDRLKIEKTLSQLQSESSTITALSSPSNIDSALEQAYTAAVATNSLVSDYSSLLFEACSTQNTTLDSYRSTLSTVRTNITTLFSDISTKRTNLTTSKNALNQATRDLELTKAGTDPNKLRAQHALVSSADAQVASAEAILAKTYIIAPFAGTISDVSVVTGETVTSGKSVISMLATSAFEVEAKVPEIDVVKIKTGDKVKITLDAYGTAVKFPAIVTRVSPDATLDGNVPVYKVLVTFIEEDPRIKSGMTANVNIITEDILSTLVIPSRFVKVIDESNGEVIVRADGKNTTEPVILGVRGEGGLIEIKSGINEGDVLVAPNTSVRSAQKQTN